MSIVIELKVSSIVDESVARAILSLLADLPGFDPRQYELNQKGTWRGWELDRAVVDLLTQRTQIFRVEGAGGTAVVATGKHGEMPTVVIDGEATDAFDETMLEGLPIRDVRIVRTPDE